MRLPFESGLKTKRNSFAKSSTGCCQGCSTGYRVVHGLIHPPLRGAAPTQRSVPTALLQSSAAPPNRCSNPAQCHHSASPIKRCVTEALCAEGVESPVLRHNPRCGGGAGESPVWRPRRVHRGPYTLRCSYRACLRVRLLFYGCCFVIRERVVRVIECSDPTLTRSDCSWS